LVGGVSDFVFWSEIVAGKDYCQIAIGFRKVTFVVDGRVEVSDVDEAIFLLLIYSLVTSFEWYSAFTFE